MHNRYRLPLCSLLAAFLLCLVFPGTGQAHRLRVFAYPDHGQIVVTASFAHNRPVAGGEVRATLKNGQVLFQGKTNSKGELRFPRPDIPPGEPLTITVSGGPGHQGTWILTPEDLGQQQTPPGAALSSGMPPARPAQTTQDRQAEKIDTIVAQAVAREIAPLKAMLAHHLDNGPSWQNIIGGIGWIVGLAGIWAIVSCRRNKEQ